LCKVHEVSELNEFVAFGRSSKYHSQIILLSILY
jgi:hypothetical protein